MDRLVRGKKMKRSDGKENVHGCCCMTKPYNMSNLGMFLTEQNFLWHKK